MQSELKELKLSEASLSAVTEFAMQCDLVNEETTQFVSNCKTLIDRELSRLISDLHLLLESNR